MVRNSSSLFFFGVIQSCENLVVGLILINFSIGLQLPLHQHLSCTYHLTTKSFHEKVQKRLPMSASSTFISYERRKRGQDLHPYLQVETLHEPEVRPTKGSHLRYSRPYLGATLTSILSRDHILKHHRFIMRLNGMTLNLSQHALRVRALMRLHLS